MYMSGIVFSTHALGNNAIHWTSEAEGSDCAAENSWWRVLQLPFRLCEDWIIGEPVQALQFPPDRDQGDTKLIAS